LPDSQTSKQCEQKSSQNRHENEKRSGRFCLQVSVTFGGDGHGIFRSLGATAFPYPRCRFLKSLRRTKERVRVLCRICQTNRPALIMRIYAPCADGANNRLLTVSAHCIPVSDPRKVSAFVIVRFAIFAVSLAGPCQ